MGLEAPRDIMKGVTEIIEAATECVESCDKFLGKVQELGKTTVVIVEQALAVLEANYRKEIKLKNQVKTALHNLIILTDREVPVLLDNVADILWYAGKSDAMAAARDGVHATPPNLGPLRGLMGQLERSLKQAKKSYSTFEIACKSTIRSLTEEAETCAVQERQCRDKKMTTKVAGGTTSGVFIGAGVVAGGVAGTIATVGTAASIVAGIPTLGIGAVVGFIATAAGTAAFGAVAATAGVVGGVATHFIAKDFENTESSLRKIQEHYNLLLSCAYSVHEEVAKTETNVKKVSMQVDHISHCIDDDQCTDLLKDALSRLQKVCSNSHDPASEVTVQVKDKLKVMKVKLHESVG